MSSLSQGSIGISPPPPPPLEGISADVILKGVGVMKKEEVKGGTRNKKLREKIKQKGKLMGKIKAKRSVRSKYSSNASQKIAFREKVKHIIFGPFCIKTGLHHLQFADFFRCEK
jgi:hypothetical protein